MKITLITTLFFLALNFLTSAQTPQRGMTSVGGAASFLYSVTPGLNVNDNSVRRRMGVSISPLYGKFVSEKWQFQTSISYSKFTYRYDNSPNSLSRDQRDALGLSVGIRKYNRLIDNLYFRLGTSVGLRYESEFSETFTSNETWSTTSFSNETIGSLVLTTGLAYFYKDRWIFSASIGAVRYDLTYFVQNESIGHSVQLFGRANGFGIGATYLLKGRKD